MALTWADAVQPAAVVTGLSPDSPRSCTQIIRPPWVRRLRFCRDAARRAQYRHLAQPGRSTMAMATMTPTLEQPRLLPSETKGYIATCYPRESATAALAACATSQTTRAARHRARQPAHLVAPSLRTQHCNLTDRQVRRTRPGLRRTTVAMWSRRPSARGMSHHSPTTGRATPARRRS
jgi:hypothetical protein